MSDVSESLFPKGEKGLVVSAPKGVILAPAEPLVLKEQTNTVPEEQKQLVLPPQEIPVEPQVETEIRYNIYQTQKGDYYAAETPKSSEDCIKPFPSPSLYKALSSKPGEVAHRDAVIETINHEGNGVPGAQRSGVCMLIGT